MARRVSPRKKWTFTILAWIVALIIFFPILWTFLTAFKTEGDAILFPPAILPPHWTVENFFEVQSRSNYFLHFFGVDPVGWLTSPDWALTSVIIANIWIGIPFNLVVLYSGLQAIPGEVYEAAALDGATTWQTYRHIIIPLLKPITISTLIILGHVSLKIFDLVFAMSGKGPGFATDVPGIFVYETTFSATRYNLGAAASVVMLFLVCVVMIPYLARSMKDVER